MKRISFWLTLLALTPGISRSLGVRLRLLWRSLLALRVHLSPFRPRLAASTTRPTPTRTATRAWSPVTASVPTCIRMTWYPAFGGPFRRASRAAFPAPRPVHRRRRTPPEPVRPPDGMEVIRQHLLAKGIQSADIDRIFRIDDQLVSVDFLLKDRNLLIKYWNPQGIQSLSTKESFKQKAYEKYRQNWTQVAARHELNGGKVYYVEASDAQTIVAALDACTNLDIPSATPGPSVMYARK